MRETESSSRLYLQVNKGDIYYLSLYKIFKKRNRERKKIKKKKKMR